MSVADSYLIVSMGELQFQTADLVRPRYFRQVAGKVIDDVHAK